MVRIKDNYFDIEKFKENIYKSVTKDYLDGGMRVSEATKTKPIPPSSKDINTLTQLILENVKGVTEELSKAIRREIRTSILAKESREDLKKRLDNIFKGDNPTRFHYETRLQLIGRTEKARIQNAGSMNTARTIGVTGKYIDIVEDNRTSEVSKAMKRKYGSEDKAIPLDEEFSVIVNGKTYSGLYPPFMPNDRDMVLYTFE